MRVLLTPSSPNSRRMNGYGVSRFQETSLIRQCRGVHVMAGKVLSFVQTKSICERLKDKEPARSLIAFFFMRLWFYFDEHKCKFLAGIYVKSHINSTVREQFYGRRKVSIVSLVGQRD